MKKLTGLSLLIAGLAVTGCSDNKSNTETHQTSESRQIIRTVKKNVTGEWIGKTLLPRSGETKQQYEERLNYLNDFNKKMDKSGDFQPRLSIFTQEGIDMYNWARRLQQVDKTGNPDDYNPKTDLYLQMAQQMTKGNVVYTKPEKTSPQPTSYKGNIRRGKTFDF